MLPPIFTMLSTDAACTALLGTGSASRVYPFGEAPADVPRPYVTWFVVGGFAHSTLADKPAADEMTVQVDCWADTAASAKAVAMAVRDSLETIGDLTNYNPSDRDPETKRYRMSFDIEIQLKR
ncbi:tail completion protein gp17 [Thermomonas sp.]